MLETKQAAGTQPPTALGEHIQNSSNSLLISRGLLPFARTPSGYQPFGCHVLYVLREERAQFHAVGL